MSVSTPALGAILASFFNDYLILLGRSKNNILL